MKNQRLARWFKTPKADIPLRNTGDAARNEGDWPKAEVAYRAHLAATPQDFEIWVQLGHSLKEQHKLAEAEGAYRHALSIKPDDADAHLQLGHVLKQTNRHAEAADAYAQSFHHAPTPAAEAEITALRDSGLLATREADVPVFIELDDLLGFLEQYSILTGIQRVEVSIVQHAIEAAKLSASPPCVFVLNPPDAEGLWALRNADLEALLGHVTGASVDHDRLQQMVAETRRNASPVFPEAGQAYFVLGGYWNHGMVASRYLPLKRAGVVLGACIYDLIAITHAQYCDEGVRHEFTLAFAEVMVLFDFVLTISDYTAQEVRRYRDRLGLPAMPVHAVPLAHGDAVVDRRKPTGWGQRIAHLRDRPFVLMVSTLEPRKNHAYLIAAWKQFLDEGLDPPDLVFVGRSGWLVAGLMELLDATRYLDGLVHVVHELSDDDLRTLYGACLYTAFPSFVEGWGLPVGESLVHGKPCVASSTSSIPEVGGELADYVDPRNLSEGIEVLRRMTFDTSYRERRTEDIRRDFQLRNWRDVGAAVLEQIQEACAGSTAARDVRVLLPPGTVFQPSRFAAGRRVPTDYALHPYRMILSEAWYRVNYQGCRMRGPQARLSFRTDLAPGTKVSVYLRLFGMEWARDEHRISVALSRPGQDGRPTRLPRDVPTKAIPSHSTFVMRAAGPVGEDGTVTLDLRVTGDIKREDGSPGLPSPGVGLSAMAYAAHSDAVTRLDVLDGIVFDD